MKTYIEKSQFVDHTPANPGSHYSKIEAGVERDENGNWFWFSRTSEIDTRLGWEGNKQERRHPMMDIEAFPRALAVAKLQREKNRSWRRDRKNVVEEANRVAAEYAVLVESWQPFIPEMEKRGFRVVEGKWQFKKKGVATIWNHQGEWGIDIQGRRQAGHFPTPMAAAESIQ